MTIFKMLNHDLKQKDSVHIHGSNNWVYIEWNGKNFFFSDTRSFQLLITVTNRPEK